MIKDHDRSGFFGGSDCKYVLASNRNTKSWKNWWDEKLGLTEHEQFETMYTRAGNLYEHSILKAVDPEVITDGQIIYDKYLLRVNYDGWNDGIIYECKTHNAKKDFKMTNDYYGQCQVEMFVYQKMHDKWFLPPMKKLVLVSYPLFDDEYDVEEDEIEIVESRIRTEEVKYNKDWVQTEYIPKVKELSRALKKGKFPTV